MVIYGGCCRGLFLTAVQLAWSHRESQNDQAPMTVLADRRPRRPSPATLEIGLTWMISFQVRDVKNHPHSLPGLCLGTNILSGHPATPRGGIPVVLYLEKWYSACELNRLRTLLISIFKTRRAKKTVSFRFHRCLAMNSSYKLVIFRYSLLSFSRCWESHCDLIFEHIDNLITHSISNETGSCQSFRLS